MTKSPPPKRKPDPEPKEPRTLLAMSKEQSIALKAHLKQYSDSLSEMDRMEFNTGPLSKIMAIL